MEFSEERKALVSACRELAELSFGSWGNASLRLSKDAFLITPSGVGFDSVKPEELVVAKLDLSFYGGKPSTELKLHARIYKNRRDVNAIVHTHSKFATALAVTAQPLPPVTEELAMVAGGEVPCTPYAPPGSERLAEEAVSTLRDGRAVLLASHGVVAVGETVEEAVKIAFVIERGAEIYFIAKAFGNPAAIPEEEVENLRNIYRAYRTGEKC